jgi:hypothetical protein
MLDVLLHWRYLDIFFDPNNNNNNNIYECELYTSHCSKSFTWII